MEIVRTDDFEKSFAKLPADAKRLYGRQESIFLKNWRDPRLHIKKLKGLEYAFSFRITRTYRGTFQNYLLFHLSLLLPQKRLLERRIT